MTPKNKAVIITGAAKRIGHYLAEDFGRNGWTVVVHYYTSENAANATVQAIEKSGGRAVAIQGDLSDESTVSNLIPRAVQKIGQPLDVLINNAAVFEYDTWETLSTEQWDRQMRINLKAPALLIQSFAAQAKGDESVVVNMIDQCVKHLDPYFTSYTISKSALWTATQTAAQWFAPRIRVNAIGLGPVLANKHQSQEEFDRKCSTIPLKHSTSLAEIYQAVCFILNTTSMTGHLMTLDGGEHLEWRTKPNESTRAPENKASP